MATGRERTAIEKEYFPTLAAQVLPEMLAEMLDSVKFKLKQKLADLEKDINLSFIRKQQFQYLVAI